MVTAFSNQASLKGCRVPTGFRVSGALMMAESASGQFQPFNISAIAGVIRESLSSEDFRQRVVTLGARDTTKKQLRHTRSTAQKRGVARAISAIASQILPRLASQKSLYRKDA